MNETKANFRCGYAALIGRPNAGKSTLLNQILRNKLAITSSKPQTTRNRIVGIHNDDDMQVILVDTPGIHNAWTELNRQMVTAATSSVSDVDVVLWLGDMTPLAKRVEAGEPVFDAEDEAIAAFLEKSGRKVIFVANKIDVIPHNLLLPVFAAVNERLPKLVAAIPVSALTGDGVRELMKLIHQQLPVHPPLFPKEQWTELSERFLCAEMIREKIFHLTEQEVPYSAAVEIRKFDEEERESQSLVKIYADIIVERQTQKGILIGKGGEMLKRIGTLARKEIAEMLGCRVYLELFVKVELNWTKTRGGLRRVGFDET